MKAEKNRKIGLIIMLLSFFIWIVDRFSNMISTSLGKMICGESYMKAVDGTVGDCSCGFNMDMYLTAVLLIWMLFGVVLYLFSKKK